MQINVALVHGTSELSKSFCFESQKSFLTFFFFFDSFAIKNFHARHWIITNVTNARNVPPSANIPSSVANGRDQRTRQRNTKLLALIQRVIAQPTKLCSTLLIRHVLLESGADVMAALQDREAKYNEEKKLFSCLVDLLSYEKITFNGELNLKYFFLSWLSACYVTWDETKSTWSFLKLFKGKLSKSFFFFGNESFNETSVSVELR